MIETMRLPIQRRRRPRRPMPGILAWLLLGALFMTGAAARAESPDADRGRIRSNAGVELWRNASPEQRRAMREEALERWQQATPRERRAFRRRMRALQRALPDFSPIERRMLLRRSVLLPKAERESLRDRLRRIDDLDPEERARLIADVEAILADDAAEVERLERNLDRWREMSEAERQEYRDQLRSLREMPLEDRRRLLREALESRQAPRSGPQERGSTRDPEPPGADAIP